MTVPDWVDPASADDAPAPAGDESRRREAPPVPPDPVLAEKPVLEWTKEDWASWIESSSGSPSPEAERVQDTGGTPGDPVVPSEGAGADATASEMLEGGREVEVRADAGATGWPDLPLPDDDERPWDEDSGFPIVDIRLPEDEADGSAIDDERPWDEPPDLAAEAAEPVPAAPSDLVDRNAPRWDEPPGLAAEAAESVPAAPSDLVDRNAPRWDEPPELRTEAGPDRESYQASAPVGWRGAPFGDVGGLPAAEAAPVDEPDLPGPVSSELSPPPLVWPLRDVPATLEAAALRAPATGPAPPRPVAGPRRAEGPRADGRVAVERSHRVRSALGLMVVAVTVGIIVAGLITVTVFAIGVALRRAVG